MNSNESCNLCLSRNTNGLPEDKQLRMKIDRIFYFEIFRYRDDVTMICESCKMTIDVFYEFSEQVRNNQQILRSTVTPSTSLKLGDIVEETLVKLECSKAELVEEDQLPYETEWVDVDSKQDLPPNTNATIDKDQSDTKIDRDWDSHDLDDIDADRDNASSVSVSDTENEKPPTIVTTKPKRKYTMRKKSSSRKGPIQTKNNVKDSSADGGTKLSDEDMVLKHFNLACDLCGKALVDFIELREHFRDVHEQLGYINCCNKKIFKKCWMVEHLQVHLNPDAFHCSICKKSYSSSRVLKDHIKEVHATAENRSLQCNVCLKRFASKRHLNAHSTMAHGSFPCPQCNKVLASQGSLKHHIFTQHGEGQQFICDICARVFRSKRCLETHVKGHLGTRQEDKVQCSVCAVWFTNKYQLTKHMNRIHIEPEKMLECNLCGKQLRNREALNGHMNRTHTESRFECEFCFKKFRRPHHMREHVAIHHTGEDLYGCNYCEERFNSKNKQYTHRKTVHPAEFEEELRKRLMKD
ncbi:transcription factor grauzone-like [Malaya genurostris]|uniref:transcription factor grauzone-like n=1 Tax=Malaya genurostris TaxID=325434 RepID=UPI0026F3A32E|nr:transcription factor grauzone-like [Malaya genurostris]